MLRYKFNEKYHSSGIRRHNECLDYTMIRAHKMSLSMKKWREEEFLVLGYFHHSQTLTTHVDVRWIRKSINNEDA